MTGIAIRTLDDTAELAWESFVALSSDATLFHRAGWRRVIPATFGHPTYFRYAVRGGDIVGILPLVHIRSAIFGRALISTGFGVYGGIAAADPEVSSLLAEDAARLGAELGVGYVELRHALPQAIGWTVKSELYATFRKAICPSDAQNMKAIPRKKRADVRKSLSQELRATLSPDIDPFFRIYAQSVRDLGTPVYPRQFFAAIKREFADDVEVSVVEGRNHGPVAALMTFFFKDQVLPYFGGALPIARLLHAYDFMYWSLMGRAAARGACIFDFGRSKRGTGSFDYKVYWGFEPEPLHYQYHLVRDHELPNINPLNPKYRWAIASWKRLPLPLANFIGPHVARQLG